MSAAAAAATTTTTTTDSKSASNCTFDYLLVLDFEATCENGVKLNPQEIIEFPLVALDCHTGTTQVVFHSYVKPVFHPKLSEFCTKLTGIQQNVVDAAPTFAEVWPKANAKLDEFLAEKKKKKPVVVVAVVTCGNWDLKTMLPEQLGASKLATRGDDMFSNWINIRTVFESHYNVPSKGMKGMLDHLKLELQGKHHSGIDDCHNIARLAIEMLRSGAKF